MSARAEAIALLLSALARVDGYDVSVAAMEEKCLRMHDVALLEEEVTRTRDFEGPLDCNRAFDFALLTLDQSCDRVPASEPGASVFRANLTPENYSEAMYRSARLVLEDAELRDIPAAAAFFVAISELYPCEDGAKQ